MPFIRDEEKRKKLENRANVGIAGPAAKAAMEAGIRRATTLEGSTGGGGAVASVPGGSRFQASTGARAPLLADYLRANEQAMVGEKALTGLEAEAQKLQQAEFKGTSEGVKVGKPGAANKVTPPPPEKMTGVVGMGVQDPEPQKPSWALEFPGDWTPQQEAEYQAKHAAWKKRQEEKNKPVSGVVGPGVQQTGSAATQQAKPPTAASLLESFIKGRATGEGVREAPNQREKIVTIAEAEKPAFATGAEAEALAQDIEQQTQALQTEAGRQAFLQEKYGKDQTYSAGESLFDAALMGALQSESLKGLQSKYKDLFETVTGKTGKAAGEYAAKVEADRLAQERGDADMEASRARIQAVYEAAFAKWQEDKRVRDAYRRSSERGVRRWEIENSDMKSWEKANALDRLRAEEEADSDFQNYRGTEAYNAITTGGQGPSGTETFEEYWDYLKRTGAV